MHFWKLNILLLVLVSTFGYIKSQDDFDFDDGSADQATGESDNNKRSRDDSGYDDDDDDNRADDDNKSNDENTSDDDNRSDDKGDDDSGDEDNNGDDDDEYDDDRDSLSGAVGLAGAPNKKTLGLQVTSVAKPCVAGTHINIDCNICYCYKPGTMSCTTTVCNKSTKLSLMSSPAKSAKYKKLRAVATGCVPGERFENAEGCTCYCAMPSVMVCDGSRCWKSKK